MKFWLEVLVNFCMLGVLLLVWVCAVVLDLGLRRKGSLIVRMLRNEWHRWHTRRER